MKSWLILAFFLFLAFGLYFKSLWFGFLSDDYIWLKNASEGTLFSSFTYLVDAEGFFYRPFTKTYFLIAYQFFNLNPLGYHVVNLVVHAVASWLVFQISWLLIKSCLNLGEKVSLSIALGSAGLFLVHPIHLENVVWVSAITELWAALFCLLCLYLFLLMVLKKQTSWFTYLVFFGSFILGLGSHEYLVVLPMLILCTDSLMCTVNRVSLKQSLRLHFIVYVGLILITLIYLALRYSAGSHWSGGDYSYSVVKLPFNVTGNLLGYLGLALVGSSFIDIYAVARIWLRQNLGISALLVGIGMACLIYVVRQIWLSNLFSSAKLFLVYLASFFILTLLPFLPLGGIAERYVYVPLLAVCLLIGLIVYHYGRAVWLTGLILAGVLSFYLWSLQIELNQWQRASDYVVALTGEFRDGCAEFKDGETISRKSPPNRLERAWVFQVGYEEAASLYCGKKISINRQ